MPQTMLGNVFLDPTTKKYLNKKISGGSSTGHGASRVELDPGYQDQQVFKGTFYELKAKIQSITTNFPFLKNFEKNPIYQINKNFKHTRKHPTLVIIV